jgi:hypothetical protein
VDAEPLTLRGTRFSARERVRVSVSTSVSAASRVTATRAGSFVVSFPGLSYDRCNGLLAVAVGSEGSRARLTAQPLCPPRL